MEETVLYPSPNWFLPSVLAASEDGWLVYGGPLKSLVALEPLPSDLDGVLQSNHRFKAHVVHRTHTEKVVSVDISPEWPEKRHFLSGSADSTVKVWSITQDENNCLIKNILSHEAHASEREEVVAVGYAKATHVVSVGNFGNVVVWDLNTNVKNMYSALMRHFKATCLSCSPHIPLVVAVGTKQGVVFVLDLNGKGNVLYKVRGQDDEIAQVSWCPQYEVNVKRSFPDKKSLATQRLEKIRNEPEPNDPDTSGFEKTLPEDSFDDSVTVPEDDMFDIYKDHEVNEFGHKKYEPEDILVKTKVEDEKDDFLAECEKLKAQILKNKDAEEESIESLVEAMDKTQIEKPTESKSLDETKPVTGVASLAASGSKLVQGDGSDHVHKHLLASISKNGYNVRIWSKTGKIVASCAVAVGTKNTSKAHVKAPQSANLHWYSPDLLLIADGKTHLLECNPLQIDYRNRLQWKVLAGAHRRSLYYVTSSAPRVQPAPAGGWSAWTVGQDRYLVKYDVENRTVLAKYGTCGGFLYDVRACPYDAGKLSVGVGDGAIRVWETQTTGEDDCKLTLGEVSAYWQNVQGKILQCAWHPTKENILAFATAEARVGVIDTSRCERPARVLQTGLTRGVYSIAWGDAMTLFAVGGKELVMYNVNKPDSVPIPIQIEIEGQRWEPTVVSYSVRGLAVGAVTGGVALFSGPGGNALAAKFVFTRAIQAVEWHPLQTSSSDEESPYRELLAVTSMDKVNAIAILKLEDAEGGGKKFTDFNMLTGHADKVLQAYWSPHRDEQILSTSQDSTVRVWDAIRGVCVSVFGGHSCGTLGAAWCAAPSLPHTVLSGGNDCCLRLWDINNYPAEDYKEVKKETKKRKKNKPTSVVEDPKESDVEKEEVQEKETDNKEIKDTIKENPDTNEEDELSEEELSTHGVLKVYNTKIGRRYILPITTRRLCKLSVPSLRYMLNKHLEKQRENNLENTLEAGAEENIVNNLECFKLFGNINEVNELLDEECDNHLQHNRYKEYSMLMIFRGRIDSLVQFANENDLIDNFLLSVAPCVSFKYWKDVTQLYIAQIDRLAAKKTEDLPSGSRDYPPVYRKVAALLTIHDVRGAVELLGSVNLFKEAYILCRCRHMDSIADEVLCKWASTVAYTGNMAQGALIYLVMGKISEAATLLRRSRNESHLKFSGELAKIVGLNILANFVETRAKTVEKPTQESTEQILQDLPTKMELLLKENKPQNGEAKTDVENGNHVDGVDAETNGN